MCNTSLQAVLERLYEFLYRGIFNNANIWCAISIKPAKIYKCANTLHYPHIHKKEKQNRESDHQIFWVFFFKKKKLFSSPKQVPTVP